MSDFTCEAKGLESSITVGQIFEFHCHGRFPVQFKFDHAQVAGLEDKYALKLLKFELRDTENADLQFTSYRVGPQKFDQVQVTDGETTLQFPSLNFEVRSVLPPQEGLTEPPKPFGPVGPMTSPMPWVSWVILLSVLGILVMMGALSWKKRRDRLDILKQVKERTKGPTPVVQFHRDLRILTRNAGLQDQQSELLIPPRAYLHELRQISETFLGQKYQLALLGQPSDKLENEFKKYAPKAYIKFKEEIKFWNKRWQKLNASVRNAKMQDYLDMTLETRSLIEKMAEEEI